MYSRKQVKQDIIKTSLLILSIIILNVPFTVTWLPYRGDKFFEYGPILSWTEDPRTTITITFQWVEHRKGFVLVWNETHKFLYEFEAEPGEPISIVVRNLSAGSLYHYVVGYFSNDKMVNWTEVLSFRTAPTGVEPFTFLVHGDTQVFISGATSFERAVEAMKKENFSFIIHLGDLVEMSRSYRMWHRFLTVEGELAKEKPLMAVIGNHDYSFCNGDKGANFRKYLALPGNEFWYTFNYSNAVFIALAIYDWKNFTMPEEELRMLVKALSVKDKWRIVYFHIPPFRIWQGTTSEEIAEKLLPIFDRLHPDLVIMGHMHGYCRFFRNGTHYVIMSSQSWYTPFYIRDDSAVDKYSFSYGYALVTISGDVLKFVFKDISGRILDEFEIRRGE